MHAACNEQFLLRTCEGMHNGCLRTLDKMGKGTLFLGFNLIYTYFYIYFRALFIMYVDSEIRV